MKNPFPFFKGNKFSLTQGKSPRSHATLSQSSRILPFANTGTPCPSPAAGRQGSVNVDSQHNSLFGSKVANSIPRTSLISVVDSQQNSLSESESIPLSDAPKQNPPPDSKKENTISPPSTILAPKLPSNAQNKLEKVHPILPQCHSTSTTLKPKWPSNIQNKLGKAFIISPLISLASTTLAPKSPSNAQNKLEKVVTILPQKDQLHSANNATRCDHKLHQNTPTSSDIQQKEDMRQLDPTASHKRCRVSHPQMYNPLTRKSVHTPQNSNKVPSDVEWDPGLRLLSSVTKADPVATIHGTPPPAARPAATIHRTPPNAISTSTNVQKKSPAPTERMSTPPEQLPTKKDNGNPNPAESINDSPQIHPEGLKSPTPNSITSRQKTQKNVGCCIKPTRTSNHIRRVSRLRHTK